MSADGEEPASFSSARLEADSSRQQKPPVCQDDNKEGRLPSGALPTHAHSNGRAGQVNKIIIKRNRRCNCTLQGGRLIERRAQQVQVCVCVCSSLRRPPARPLFSRPPLCFNYDGAMAAHRKQIRLN